MKRFVQGGVMIEAPAGLRRCTAGKEIFYGLRFERAGTVKQSVSVQFVYCVIQSSTMIDKIFQDFQIVGKIRCRGSSKTRIPVQIHPIFAKKANLIQSEALIGKNIFSSHTTIRSRKLTLLENSLKPI